MRVTASHALIRAAVATAALALLATACAGRARDLSDNDAPVVDGKDFTLSIASDPGALDPQASASSALLQVSSFAYDTLVSADAYGKIAPQLAERWQVNGPTNTFVLRDGITCADGSPLTAGDVAANFAYVADPANKSPFLGVFLPVGATARADDATRTVTLSTPQAAPFVLLGLASLPMVCAKGMADRSSLARGTDGTGPYTLTEAVPDDHYTFRRRDDYVWGPDGARADTKGMPPTVTVRVVANETTAANLLLSGEVNAASVLGPDAGRLKESGLFGVDVDALAGEMWFNHDAGRPGADPAVRQALLQSLDLDQLTTVLTSGRGGPPTTFAAVAPVACPGDSVSSALPAADPAAAGSRLDQAGWTKGADGVRAKDGRPLAVTFVTNTAGGSGGAAAAELAAATWKSLGVQVTSRAVDETALNDTIFSTGDWDITWVALNVNSPDQIVPFMSGPAAPAGTNFAHIDNAAYTDLAARAAAEPGAAGCSLWLQAETQLVAAADVVPFANQRTTVFGKGARFAVVGSLIPTSVRMLAS